MFFLVISMEKLEIVFPTRDLKVGGPQTLPLTYPRVFKYLLCAYVRHCKQDKASGGSCMVTQEIMDRWMDGGIIFSNNSLKKK